MNGYAFYTRLPVKLRRRSLWTSITLCGAEGSATTDLREFNSAASILVPHIANFSARCSSASIAAIGSHSAPDTVRARTFGADRQLTRGFLPFVAAGSRNRSPGQIYSSPHCAAHQ